MHRQLNTDHILIKATDAKGVCSQEILQDLVLWNGTWNSFSLVVIILMMIIVITSVINSKVGQLNRISRTTRSSLESDGDEG